jgi:hypothetical protein
MSTHPLLRLHSFLTGRRRGAILVEVALMLPVVVFFFVVGAQTWYGFSRQETYSKTALTIAEWGAREGVINQTMTDPLRTLMISTAGVEDQVTYLHITVLDGTGGCPAESTTTCEIGSTLIPVSGSSPVLPSSNGWDDASLVAGIDVPYGAYVEVEIWSHQALTGQSAIRALSGFLESRWAIPLGRAVAVGSAP